MKRAGHGWFGNGAGFIAALLVFLTGSAHAERSPVAFESSYLGDGWFEYSAITTDDPFFLFLDLPGVALNFGEVIDSSPLPTRWTNNISGSQIYWGFDGIALGAQVRPYRATFRLRSPQTTFKRQRYGGTVLMSLAIVGGYHGYLASANIVGYWNADILLPCAPEEADGSATNLLVWSPMINGLPEPRLTEVVRNADEPVGVAFEYPELSTVRLEGSRDFRGWTNIAYIHGQAGITTWTTNTLASYGNFFRLRLVAEGHATNMPPLGSTSPLVAPGKSARVSKATSVNCAPAPDGVQLTIGSTARQTYIISALDSNLHRGESLRIKATGKSAAVRLPGAGGPFGFYEVSEAP